MEKETNEQIVIRFFEAINELKQRKAIRGVQTFTRKYEINRRNFLHVQHDPSSGMFKVAWLNYLVLDFGISAEWLLTGSGDMLKRQNLANFVHKDILPM